MMPQPVHHWLLGKDSNNCMNCSECYWHEQCGDEVCAANCSDFTPLAEMSARDVEEYFAQLQDRYEIYEDTISSLK